MTSILKKTRSSITDLKHLRLNRRNHAYHDENNMILETSSLFLLMFTNEIFMLDFDDINIKFMSSNSLIEEV
jgi:prenyltransferase beta subunit